MYVWGSHGGECEDGRLLGCSAVQSLIALFLEAVQTSETLVNLFQSTRRYNPEDSHLLGICLDQKHMYVKHWGTCHAESRNAPSSRITPQSVRKTSGHRQCPVLWRPAGILWMTSSYRWDYLNLSGRPKWWKKTVGTLWVDVWMSTFIPSRTLRLYPQHAGFFEYFLIAVTPKFVTSWQPGDVDTL
jgi:hypothetical protein